MRQLFLTALAISVILSPVAVGEPPGWRPSVLVLDGAGSKVFPAVCAGRYSAVWDGMDDAGRRVAEGIYFVRLESGNGCLSTKAVRLE